MIDSKITQYRIAKDTGISQPMITRFVKGDRGISLDTADKVVEYLSLELVRRDN
jgi:predicted transcriptional regulator